MAPANPPSRTTGSMMRDTNQPSPVRRRTAFRSVLTMRRCSKTAVIQMRGCDLVLR